MLHTSNPSRKKQLPMKDLAITLKDQLKKLTHIPMIKCIKSHTIQPCTPFKLILIWLELNKSLLIMKTSEWKEDKP